MLNTTEASDDTLPAPRSSDGAPIAGAGEVCLATTPEELEAVARFRYVVHVEKERSTPLGTDHANRMVWPTEPGIRSDFYACDANRRMVECASLWMDLPSKETAERLGLGQAIAKSRMPVAYLDALTIAPDSLWSRRMARLLCRMYCFTREHGRVVGITHCNPVLASHYERFGLYRCGRPIVRDDFGLQIPMVLFLEDVGHFEKIGSLLLPYARHYENDPLQVARLKSDFDIRTPFFERTMRPLMPPVA
ncbi:hypothetical protein [Noviherbaspirillum sp. Root189]|uniref:hypothetical protein n=1 Tax=Noviherbaspirillum sp. Root189 TaxID=1736487 RepID=UPI00070EA928|nr:hypothetical protein [Noviherbaspirillum sp. Root189]KRB66306.1 hypothetical protein ASE07_10520 [Noviherbaspirillum sp. Root189]